jgi:Xaa-Pro aminopeptidase
MTVEDYRALQGADFDLIDFNHEFDMVRAVKSDWELTRVRESMDLIQEGFWSIMDAFEPGKSEEEVMAPCVETFTRGGSGPRIMNIILSGTEGEAEAHFKLPGDRIIQDEDLLMYSLEVTDREGYWTEFSRVITRHDLSGPTRTMADIYPEALDAARRNLKAGNRGSDVHNAFNSIFEEHGLKLGHLSGHGIGTTMIEDPAIGENEDTVLKENMILSFHPQVVDEDGEICLYAQDTFRVGEEEGENLSEVPWRLFDGTETRASVLGE